MRKDAFSSIHPAVTMAFFLFVTLITAFVLHPVITGISLVSACAYHVMLKGRKALIFCLCFVLPFTIVVAVLNPLFNHAGTTVLFYLKNGNPVTKEAVLYGLVSACMFAALIIWFSCLNCVMDSDKYVYLFGRAAPTLSLIFSMVMRFVPRFFQRIKEVSTAQKSIRPEFKKSPVKAVSHAFSVLSVTVTWALENAVTTADSMKSRGYGLPKRSAFAIYRFDGRDAVFAIVMGICFIVSVIACATGSIRFRFYPSIKYSGMSLLWVFGCAAFLILCLLPVFLNIKEDIQWRYLRSKI